MFRKKSKISFLSHSEGKGTIGCFFAIILLVCGVFAGTKLIPVYYAATNFETDLKNEVSRAGANSYKDENLAESVIAIAQKNDILLEPEDISIERVAGEFVVKVHWEVPVDLIIFEHTFQFDLKTRSFIGRL